MTMDAEFHNEVLAQSCSICNAMLGSECRSYAGRLVYPPHQGRWVKVVDARYKAYAQSQQTQGGVVMPDYTVTLTVIVPIEARNQTQAEERASRVEDALKLDLDKRATWAGDMEMAHEIEEA